MNLKPSFVSLVIIGVACVLASHAQPAAASVEIESVGISGQGCPQGSVHPTISPNGAALSILFDRFNGQVEPGTKVVRVVCDIKLVLRKPLDMTFAFQSADFRGFVNLEAGVRAVQKVRLIGGFDENGVREANMSQQKWVGPVSENFEISAVQPEEGAQLVGCAKRKNKTQIRLRTVIALHNKKTAGSGVVMVDSFDSGMLQRYNLQWAKCQP